MHAMTAALWPIRYKPLPDELLSSWLVRLAHGHGLKVQTFCNVIFGNRFQVWNRDVDRLAPKWLVDELSRRTGTPLAIALGTTLRAYEGVLYRRFRSAGILNWILTLKMYHRKRKGFGLQYCPACLAEDNAPYFRKQWRLALLTVCRRHGLMLLDRCPTCHTPIAVHRVDMSKLMAGEDFSLSFCHACGFDLRASQTVHPNEYDKSASMLLKDIAAGVSGNFIEYAEKLENLEVLRQLTGLMTSRYKHVHLREFVTEQLQIKDIPLTPGRISFEARPLVERHHLIQLATWLLADLESRLTEAWNVGAIRYNLLLKDFMAPPQWYVGITGKFSNWRVRG